MSRDRLTRWRLVLGGGEADGITAGDGGLDLSLDAEDRARDAALAELYGSDDRGSGLGRSSPRVARWLGDIRTYFPSSVVQVMQRDAMDRLGLRQLLLEPELLDAFDPDVELVATLVGLGAVIPEHSRATARAVVRKVTDELEARLAASTTAAVAGAIDRTARARRPRHHEIDWGRTIAANLRHYQAEHGTVIPERMVGNARRMRRAQRDVVLCVDQSGSMAPSVVYASVFAAVLASVRTVQTRLIAFDTEVVDLTEHLHDPVDVLFGLQLGGGTDINRALAYCEGVLSRPSETVLVLISDLYEGGATQQLLRRVRTMVDAGVTFVALLALSDAGAPAYDHGVAADLAALGVPAFACTPDHFPGLMAAAIGREDLARWAGERAIVVAEPADGSV